MDNLLNIDGQKMELKDIKYNTRTILLGLWLIILILYCFINIKFYNPSFFERLFFTYVDQKAPTESIGLLGWLLYNLFILLPNIMIFLSLFAIISCLFIKVNILKYLNIIFGIISMILFLFTYVNEWRYQIFFSILIIGINLFIIIISIKWIRKIKYGHTAHNKR